MRRGFRPARRRRKRSCGSISTAPRLSWRSFGNVIARGGSAVVISSQSGHRLGPLPVEQSAALATTPVEELLGLSFLQPEQVTDPLHAYQISKRANVLRVM